MTINDYIIACTNLYGMIHKDRLCFIYNHHHPDKPISPSFHVETMPLLQHHIFYEKDFFIHEAIYFNNEMSYHLEQTNNKPYYMINQQEIELFKDDEFMEENPYYDSFFSYLRQELQLDAITARNSIKNIHLQSRSGIEHQYLLQQFESYLQSRSMEEVNALLQHITTYYNHVKQWNNNGFSAYELKELTSKNKKIKRNDLCPCGSGKKYKKCCIDKPYPILNEGPLSYEDVFMVNPEEIDNYLTTITTNLDKIKHLVDTDILTEFQVGMDLLIKNDADLILLHRPKDITAALILNILQRLLLLTEEKEETILRTLRNYSKQKEINVTRELLEGMILQEENKFIDEGIYEELDEFFTKQNHKFIKSLPTNIFRTIKSLQKKQSFKKDVYATVQHYSHVLFNSQNEKKYIYAYNLMHLSSFAHSMMIIFLNPSFKTEYKDLLQAIIKAFETSHPLLISDPSLFVYSEDDNSEYILALDALASYYKLEAKCKKAIPYYETLQRYDIPDKFIVKESLLFCYIVTGHIEEFNTLLQNMEDNSLHKIMLTLYQKVLLNEPLHHEYITAYAKSKRVLDLICGITDEDDCLTDEEQLFINDFHQILTHKKETLEPLIELHLTKH